MRVASEITHALFLESEKENEELKAEVERLRKSDAEANALAASLRSECEAERRERARIESGLKTAYAQRDKAEEKRDAAVAKAAKCEGELTATQQALKDAQDNLRRALDAAKEETTEMPTPEFDVDVIRDGANMVRSFKVRQQH